MTDNQQPEIAKCYQPDGEGGVCGGDVYVLFEVIGARISCHECGFQSALIEGDGSVEDDIEMAIAAHNEAAELCALGRELKRVLELEPYDFDHYVEQLFSDSEDAEFDVKAQRKIGVVAVLDKIYEQVKESING